MTEDSSKEIEIPKEFALLLLNKAFAYSTNRKPELVSHIRQEDFIAGAEWAYRHLHPSPSGAEKLFDKNELQDAFDAGHDRGSYSAGGCDLMGVGYSPSFREWFEKEHPDKLSAKEIKDANESENWHPQDYSGRNKPPIPGDK
jgi:hypothetical protein